MKFLVSAVILFVSVLSVTAEKARFDNYRVYRIDVETHDQLSALRQISETSDSYSFWDEPNSINSKVEIMVPPHQYSHFGEIVEKFGFNTELLHEDWQKILDLSTVTKEPKNDGTLNWTSYHRYSSIMAWVDALVREFPQWLTVETLGNSYEGRPIKVVKLSKRTGNRAIFIEANIHAREWISGATATYVLDQLLRSTNSQIVDLSTNVDWHMILIANPDGYEFCHTDNRNWRKTRRPSSAICFGTDPNRNFAFNWLIADEGGNLGASTSACSDTYAGPAPFSDPETNHIEQYLSRNHQSFDIYLAFHSYAHMILFPLGNTSRRVSNFAAHQAIGDAAGNSLFAVNGIRYLVGNSREALYATSGTSVDHAFGKYNIPIGYTYEMRGNGAYGNFGFALPPNLILPNAQEVLQSLVGMVVSARTHGFLRV